MQQKPIVLIVDDNPTNLAVLLEHLDASGFRVLIAEDGVSAIERARRAGPDIILLDVMMPGMDGFETFERLAADPTTSDIPVIFMTALNGVEDKVRCFRAGAVDYVSKPFQHEEVQARITNHCRMRQLREELQERNRQLEEEVTRRQESQAALQSSFSELEVRNRQLDTFTRAVAHDLRNELSHIVMGAEVLAEELGPSNGLPNGLSQEQGEILDSIVSNGQRMKDTFHALLLLGQLRRGVATLRPLDMSTIIARVRQRLAPVLLDASAEIIEPEVWPRALGYGPWVEEVWFNYVSNAVKYGGVPPRIEVGATPRDGGVVRCWVQDNGAGIPDDVAGHLFSDQVILDEDRVKGYGLGLIIVKQIVEKLDGEVGVHSEAGQGSTFYFDLPTA